VPVKRAYVLTAPDDLASALVEVYPHQIPVELLRYFPLPDALLQGDTLKTYFDASVQIARTVSVFRLLRPADFTDLYAFVDNLKTQFR
jgi:hypothetical protein